MPVFSEILIEWKLTMWWSDLLLIALVLWPLLVLGEPHVRRFARAHATGWSASILLYLMTTTFVLNPEATLNGFLWFSLMFGLLLGGMSSSPRVTNAVLVVASTVLVICSAMLAIILASVILAAGLDYGAIAIPEWFWYPSRSTLSLWDYLRDAGLAPPHGVVLVMLATGCVLLSGRKKETA